MKLPVELLNKHTKIIFFQKQQTGRQNMFCLGGADNSGRGEDIRKGSQRMNIVEILDTHVCKWKNESC
jgi:hypothetical protein